MKLSAKQMEVLAKLRLKDGSSYSLGARLNTLEALNRLGLVSVIGQGHIAFPTSGQWRITDAGKAAIFKLPETVT